MFLVMVRNHGFIERMPAMAMVAFIKDQECERFNANISFMHCIHEHLGCYHKDVIPTKGFEYVFVLEVYIDGINDHFPLNSE